MLEMHKITIDKDFIFIVLCYFSSSKIVRKYVTHELLPWL